MTLDTESNAAKLTLDKPRTMTPNNEQDKWTPLRLSGSVLWLSSCIPLTTTSFIYSSKCQLRAAVEENSYQLINQVVI